MSRYYERQQALNRLEMGYAWAAPKYKTEFMRLFYRRMIASDWLEAPNNVFLDRVVQLSGKKRYMVGSLEYWKAPGGNWTTVLVDLFRFLYARFPVPAFLLREWIDKGDENLLDYILKLAHGKSSLENMPAGIPLTKELSHHFLNAPENCSAVSAFRYAQVRAAKGTDALYHQIMNSSWGNSIGESWVEEQRRAVIYWLAKQRSVCIPDMQIVLDFIDMAGNPAHPLMLQTGNTDQPRIFLWSRNLKSLVEYIHRWKMRRGRAMAHSHIRGEPMWKETWMSGEFTAPGVPTARYQIYEVANGGQLSDLGYAMRNCVFNYLNGVRTGVWSIFQMDRITEQGVRPVVTIQLHRKDRRFMQAKGKANRPLTDEEKLVLRQWWDAMKDEHNLYGIMPVGGIAL